MEARNARIYSREGLTRRNIAGNRSEGRILNGKWLALLMV
jgi:hypothetical protein